ncbi:MAG: 1-deoxy-D-xylulose-5-phosphate synthase N-terminal domain-containing protein, partial [Parachlamydiales bacterium]
METFLSESLLDSIQDPRDLDGLSLKELESLAFQIRQKILQVLSLNGGHLSSNLGIVELSIALHKVFHSPKDKLLFDTSHQTYSHKLLTGRLKTFATLRQFQGLCGFASPKESPHDHFFAGHAGTALSLALGLAKSRDLSEGKEHVIPVIGDGSLTNGLIFEALNNLPKDLKRFLVVLNDNGLAISQNVGHMKNILSRLINHPKANKLYFNLQ